MMRSLARSQVAPRLELALRDHAVAGTRQPQFSILLRHLLRVEHSAELAD